MKFSHSLQFNSVPDWASHYIAYSTLKKLIYQIEREIIAGSDPTQDDIETAPQFEGSPLLDKKSRSNAIFIPALNKELEKIKSFYSDKEKELLEEIDKLISDYAVFENNVDNASIQSNTYALSRSYQSLDESQSRRKSYSSQRRARSSSDAAVGSYASSDDDDVETHGLQSSTIGNRFSIDSDRLAYMWRPSSLEDERIRLKKRTIETFVRLSELKSFVSLNNTGFSKILKKYDKITNGVQKLKSSYLNDSVGEAYPFKQPTRQKLEEKISRVQEIYANLCTNADMDTAMRELKAHLREFIVWERNTIWRDIIGLERKSHAVGITEPVTLGGHNLDQSSDIPTPFGKVNVPNVVWRKALVMSISIGVFVFLLNAKYFKHEEQRNCFAMLVFVSILWATEVIPLFVTSLLVPLLAVCLGVLRREDNHHQLPAHDATKYIFQAMFSPVIMLLLGGFAIAGALSKYHIAKIMATFVLSKAGTKPSFVLLSIMFVATFASMWISNVAAPVLCLSIVQPILRNLPPNHPFGRCLILGIALASNVGGLASPISSPQNIIAIGIMNPSATWVQWFLVSIPLCILINLLLWVVLLWNYVPTQSNLKILPIRPSKDPWTKTQIFVISVTGITILLWCIEKRLESFFGDMGVIAIVPLVLFFGTGILTKEDFNNFLWTVIILAMGGIALGRAVDSSGLLHTIAKDIQGMIGDLHPWQVLSIFSVLVLVVTTFISHTVGALIILPIVAEVGGRLSDPRPNLLVMGSAFICSSAMGLPVSGFPNMNAIMMEDEMGVRYLSTIDFLKSGVPGSILAMLCVITIGYGLMSVIGLDL